jgi:hypothetical protein
MDYSRACALNHGWFDRKRYRAILHEPQPVAGNILLDRLDNIYICIYMYDVYMYGEYISYMMYRCITYICYYVELWVDKVGGWNHSVPTREGGGGYTHINY